MIPNGYLSQNVKVIKVADAAGAATSAVNGAGIDMANAEGVLFVTSFGTPASNNSIKSQQSDDDGAADDYTDLTGTSVGVGASDEDVYVDVIRPKKRYVRPVVSRGTSSALGDIWAIVYGLRSVPYTNTVSGTQAGETHHSPAEGTA